MRTKKVVASAVLAAGLLAGCGSQGVAATVNGETITTNEVDQGMSLAPFYAQPPAPANVVASLIQARAVIDAAQAAGVGASPSEAVEFLDSIGAQDIQVDGAYPDPVLDLARMNLISQQLPTAPEGQTVINEVNDFMAGAQIEFNPRYGEWNAAEGGLVQNPPEWIETRN